MKNIFVTGIGTDVGKTVASAILVKALNADYWKPIQSGVFSDELSDRITVKNLVNDPNIIFHSETYNLSQPLSPHAAAKLDHIDINLDLMQLPDTKNRLIIEGAGGLLVPLNQKNLVVDLITHLKCHTIVISKNYLGSINHTLLTIESLKSRNIPIIGILFNGLHTPESENIIASISGQKILGRIDQTDNVNQAFIKEQSDKLRLTFENL